MNINEEVRTYLDRNGKLKVFPAKKRSKVVALLFLASNFQHGINYTEKQVNEIITENHTFSDTCMLRRELYNKGFLSRSIDGSNYWLSEKQPTIVDLGFEDSSLGILFDAFKRKLPDYKLLKLREQMRDKVYDLQSSNPYYYSIELDRPITYEECLDDLEEVPTGIPLDQKYYFGFFKSDELEAVMDYVIGYDYRKTSPKETVWIGFLMVHALKAHQGLGKQIVQAFMEAARESEYRKLQLACFVENEIGFNFWKKVGFNEIGRTSVKSHEGNELPVIVMEYEL
ncbi:MAG TPA: GNAT family N-acetyltransferase [Lachnospiraceae bacterium]|nr:GNAT family N-acetyltransferase [Lachnospiraceae bacterium]